MKKNRLLYILFCLIIMMGSCSSGKDKIAPGNKMPAPPTPAVDVMIAGTESISEQLEIPGTILPEESTELHPEVSGRLTYLNIREGRFVSAGTLIARTYNEDLVAQYNKLKVQKELAEQTLKRYEALLGINGVSQQEYDVKKLDINNIRADMEIVHSNIRKTEVRAPFSGILGLKMVSEGAFVSPTTILTTLKKSEQLMVDFNLPERYLEKVAPGSMLDFYKEVGKEQYQARIDATESGITTENRSLTIRAKVIGTHKELIPGSFVKVKLAFHPDTAALMLPSQAVIPQARGKKIALLKNGVIQMTSVETGFRDSARVQILSGLSAGDTVVLSGLMGMKPGMSVTVKKIIE